MPNRITVLSLGAGLQSTALALLLDEGRLDAAKPDYAIFADTGAEPPWVYETVEALSQRLSYPMVTAALGNLEADTWSMLHGERVEHRHKSYYVDIPVYGQSGLMPRQCTTYYKIRPIRAMARQLAGWPCTVDMYLGISRDEVVRVKESRVKYIRHLYPLLDAGWSRLDCATYLAAEHPDIPVGRSACYFCPFHSPAEWRQLAKKSPELMARAIELDDALQEVKRGPFSLVRTGSLRKALVGWEAQTEFPDMVAGDECTGHCFV